MRNKLLIILLILVPVIFMIAGIQFDRTKYSTDPESAYLLNGVNIAELRAVGHFDNPGTTVQMYSAIVLRVTHLLRSNNTGIETDVLQNSEYYIEVLRHSLIVLNSLLIFLLGYTAFSLFRNFWLAIILQVSPFLSVTLMEENFTKVAPEPVLFATILVLAMLLMKFYCTHNEENKKYVWLFALISGFGLATKMTFLPFIIIPFLILDEWRKKLLYSVLIIPSFVLFTLPAVKGYPHMVSWFFNLSTHTGTYGQGNSGIIDPSQYLNSLLLIAQNNKVLVIELILAAFVLLLFGLVKTKFSKSQSQSDKGLIILISVLAAQLGSIILVAKHYHSNHYLFPALSLIGFVIVFIFLIIRNYVGIKGQQVIKISQPLVLAVLLGAALLNVPDLVLAYNGYRDSNKDTDETLARIDRDYKGFVKTYFYPSSFNVYSSLRWGNVYSKQIHTNKLMQLFPEGLFYNGLEKSFQFWETGLSPAEFVHRYGDRILLVGGPKSDEEYKMVEDGGLKLKKLYEGRIQVIYEIDIANSALFNGAIRTGQTVWTLQNDFENISTDKLWVMAGDHKFCKNSQLVTEKPRSGKYSFLLPWKDSYAMNFELKNVKPNQSYEVSVWRFGGDEESFLVAASKKADLFYQASKGYSETDKNGWKKLNLSVTVPELYPENTINIYLWNHSNKPAWFDDFEIKQYK